MGGAYVTRAHNGEKRRGHHPHQQDVREQAHPLRSHREHHVAQGAGHQVKQSFPQHRASSGGAAPPGRMAVHGLQANPPYVFEPLKHT